MLNEQMKELLKNLGFVVMFYTNDNIKAYDLNNNNAMIATINREVKVDGVLEKIVCDNAEGHLVAYTSVLELENKKGTPMMHEIEIKTNANGEFLQAICADGSLIISKGKFVNSKKYIDRLDTIIYSNGVLDISFGEKMACVYNIENDFLASEMSGEEILSVFSEDERILTLLTYYSNFYPDLIEAVTNITQKIVSKSTTIGSSRKREIKVAE